MKLLFSINLKSCHVFLVELEVELPSAPSYVPQFVNELIPHIMKLLQSPNVDKDKKLCKYLHKELGALLTLEERYEIMYKQLNQILDSQGKVNKQVRRALMETSMSHMITPTLQSTSSLISTHQSTMLHYPVTFEPKSDSLISKPAETNSNKHIEEWDGLHRLDFLSLNPPVIFNAEDSCSFIPCIAFGKADWEKYFGDIGEGLPLPKDIGEILNSPCSFWLGKKVKETHLLVLIPNTVNGRLFSLNYLEKLIQNPKSGHATKYRYYNEYIKKRQGDVSYPSHWVLITRDVVPGSRFKNYSEQCDLIDKHSQSSGLLYELPCVLEAVASILVHYVKTREHLYTDDKLGVRWTFTRCKGRASNELPSVVGGFSCDGLDINYCSLRDTCGVAGVRKF